MAATPGGLTANIRRKLQEGKTPDDIVKELVAGGLGQASAQRFVDRALAEDATAPPLPPPAEVAAPAAPADGLDQFIQTKTAETEAENAKTGRKSLWVASVLMCSGIAITGFSYVMADPGERFTLMWGPVVFGFLLWGKSVLGGLANFRTFAWFSAIASIAVPLALTVVLLGVVAASEPTEESAQLAESMEQAETPRTGDGAGPSSPYVNQMLYRFETTTDIGTQCHYARELAKATGDAVVDAVDGLMEHYDAVPVPVQKCIRETVMKLDPEIRLAEPGQ